MRGGPLSRMAGEAGSRGPLRCWSGQERGAGGKSQGLGGSAKRPANRPLRQLRHLRDDAKLSFASFTRGRKREANFGNPDNSDLQSPLTVGRHANGEAFAECGHLLGPLRCPSSSFPTSRGI